MDGLEGFLGLLVPGGGATGALIYLFLQVRHLKEIARLNLEDIKEEIDEEKQHGKNLANRLDYIYKDFDARIKEIEMKASKYWSQF